MKNIVQVLVAFSIFFAGSPLSSDQDGMTELQRQVSETERSFAKTMAQRDFDGFASFLADEAVFFSGEQALRGKEKVLEAWKPFYEQANAPFSWEPKTVEVLESGTLALSSGPVFDPQGRQVATFNSVWRLEASGEWRIVFDKGSAACESSKP